MGAIDLAEVVFGEQLGKGTEGIVYRARLGQADIVVKALAPTSQAAAEQVRRRLDQFFGAAEGSTAPILLHGTLGSAPARFSAQMRALPSDAIYLLMPHLPSPTLFAALQQKPFTDAEVAAAAVQLADALCRLPAGVSHGDVGLGHAFVNADGALTLIDQSLVREPTPDEDAAAWGRCVEALLGGDRPALRALSELARASVPRLPELLRRSREIAATVGVKPSEAGPVLAARYVAEPVAAIVHAPVARRRVRPETIVIGAAVAIFFAPYVYMNSPWRPPPRTVLTTDSPIVKTHGGVYDRTGTVVHPKILQPLRCGQELADGRKGFIEIEIAEPIQRLAILSSDKYVLWELTDPPVGELHCFDVLPDDYYVEQDRNLPQGLQHDPKPFYVDVLNPLKLRTTSDTHLAPLRERHPTGFWAGVRDWWWNGFE